MFPISSTDEKFYADLNLPIPTHCPNCRTQRRMATRNEKHFYPDTCDKCQKKIISTYSEEKKQIVYCHDCWWSDKWQGLDYGKNFDFEKSFFSQFQELQKKIPRAHILKVGGMIENSDYCNYVGDNKNCYLLYGSIHVEDCYYGNPYYCKNCVDSLLIRDCELCYECITSEHLYQCQYCQDCFNSHDLLFCYDCKGCSDCFGCVGLRNKQNYIFNQAYSKDEYNLEKKRINLCDSRKQQRVLDHFQKIKQKVPRKYMLGIKNENISGNYINESKKCFDCFDIKRCENTNYSAQVIDLKDCLDNNYTEENELCVDYIGSWKNYRCLYSNTIYHCRDIWYSELCYNCTDCFGCVGLRNKQFCIFNKQYTEAEYFKIKKDIISAMQKNNEFGDFFPISKSIFAYNETVANEYFFMPKEDVLAKGWAWKEKEDKDYQKQAYRVPPEIARVPETICREVLACHECGKNYKIIPQELAFYKQEKLAIPKQCPECRHLRRMAMRTPRDLWKRQCMCTQPDHSHQGQCQNIFNTAYSPDRKELVYCEDCYNKEIY